jgi:hypothetical protein
MTAPVLSVNQLPPNERLQYNMIHAHNTLKAGYDVILSHLDNPPKDDLKNFLGYCEAWADSIGSHHDAEGTSYIRFVSW